jgi:hypothetical protein
VLGALEHHDCGGQPTGQPDWAAQPGDHRQRGRDRELQQLEPLVSALAGAVVQSVRLRVSVNRPATLCR